MNRTGCVRCSSDTSPVVICSDCGHTFCVKCILYLWSRQRVEEPCICPIDNQNMTWLRPSTIPFPEEIGSIIRVYNRLFHPVNAHDMVDTTSRNLGFFIGRMYMMNMCLFLAGLLRS